MLGYKRERNAAAYEQQAKFVHDRISHAERHFGELCTVFAAYTRKAARLRDKCDDVAKVALGYAESEDVNKSTSDGLASFAHCFSVLGDFGDLRAKKLETDVVSELCQYETVCKSAKEQLKHIFSVRDRELARKRQLDRIRQRNPHNRQQITQAETELLKASAEVSRTIHGLEEQTNDFERRKLHDLKALLLHFVFVEMAFHAKALETLTRGYQDVSDIDEDSDLQDFQTVRGSLDLEFRQSVRSPDTVPHYSIKRNSLRTSQSLGSLTSTPTKSALRRPSSTGHLSQSTETLESIDVDDIPSAESVAASESDNSSASEITNKFLARKHGRQKK